MSLQWLGPPAGHQSQPLLHQHQLQALLLAPLLLLPPQLLHQVATVETVCSPSSMATDNMTAAPPLMEADPGAPPRWTALVSMLKVTMKTVWTLLVLEPVMKQLSR